MGGNSFPSCQVRWKVRLIFHVRKFDINKKFNVLNLKLHCFFQSLSRWGLFANSSEYEPCILSCSFRGHAVTGEVIVTLPIRTVFCGFSYLFIPCTKRSLFYGNTTTLISTFLLLGWYWRIWHSEDRASWYILTIKPTRSTNFSNLFLE